MPLSHFLSPPSRGPAKLLIVDDDPLVRDMAARSLRHGGFRVQEVGSGEDALAAMQSESFDLVLLDVVMAGIDGFETCQRLRALDNGRHVPVLMLTGLDDLESIERAHQAGATDFITKPIHWGLLLYRVRYALRGAAALEAVRRSRESMERAQRMAHLGSWSLDTSGRMRCSDELARIFGAHGDAAHGTTAEAFLERVSPADRDAVRRARAALAERGEPYQLTFTIERVDGVHRTVFEQAAPVYDALKRQIGIEGITHDITDRVEAERRIRHLALHDTLTGLPNRDFFLRLSTRVLEQARPDDAACALLQVDIDRFKSVNDALGSEAGDEVLRVVAERLQNHTRAGDLAAVAPSPPHPGVLGRVGANTFTLLLADITQPEHAARAAERLQQVIGAPIEAACTMLHLTTSIGIALHPRDAKDPASLIRFAEQALYAAKAAGAGQHRFFDEAMNAQASARLAREAELRRAIAEGELRVHLQPKVHAVSRAVLGAEALVRWQHPERGLLPPAEFIGLAEETGQIVDLTSWMLTQVGRLQVQWSARGLAPVPVALNVSAACFEDRRLVEQLADAARSLGFAPEQLVIEVTESTLMKDLDGALSRLHALHDQGFKVSLDDFGTGYSSLAYLKRLPIDELKIDRSFVCGVGNGPKDTALVAAIVTLARRLDLQVVAEGVETEAQAKALRALGCDIHQGFLYGHPMPVEDFEKLLHGEHAGSTHSPV